MNRIAQCCLALIAGIGLLGCGDNSPGGSQTTVASISSSEMSPLIDYIPAGTPYVLANLSPMPTDVTDKLWKAIDPWLKFAQRNVERALDAELDDATLTEQERLGLAMAREISGKLNREGFKSLGLDASYFAVYGNGLMPVIRIQLNDGELLNAAKSRVESDAGTNLAQMDQGSYFEGGDEHVRVFVGLTDGQLIFSMGPTGAGSESMVKQLLGGEMPKTSVSDDLFAANDQYGLQPHGTMIIDTARIIEAVLSDDTPIANQLFGNYRSGLSAVCEQEIRSFADIAPRIVSGYTELNERVMTQKTVVELRPDISAGLATFAVDMPGLVANDDGLISGAFGIDVMAVREFARERVAAIKADPFQCERLADLMAQIDEADRMLGQPLPPMTANFQGLRFRIDDIELSATGGEPDVKGVFALGVTNPQALIGMGQMMSPEFAQLTINYDGDPIAIEHEMIPSQVESPYLAVTNEGIALSVGAGQETGLKAFLNADGPGDDGPLMVFSYDMQEIGRMQRGMMDDAMRMQQSMAAEGQSEAAMMADLTAAMDAYNEIFSRVSAEISMTADGLEVISSTHLN